MEDKNENALKEYAGGCHCKKVRWTVMAPFKLVVFRCNCSICVMKQNHHFIVPKENFNIIDGEDCLLVYKFNSEKAQHKFCINCGVQSFYHPRSNPNGVAVTIYCVDDFKNLNFEIIDFDGENWENEIINKSSIKSYSKES